MTTMSQTARTGTHGYHDVYQTTSRDEGRTWSQPVAIAALQRRRQDDGYEVVAGDLCPKFHAQTKRVLVTGKTFNFQDGTSEDILREQVAYIVYMPETDTWGTMRTLTLPAADHAGRPILAPNAGCHQRVDLPDGDILLPIGYQTSADARIYTTIVARCRFDGDSLTYMDHGTEHSITTGRGLYEPSLTDFDGRFFLTIRADDGAWVRAAAMESTSIRKSRGASTMASPWEVTTRNSTG